MNLYFLLSASLLGLAALSHLLIGTYETWTTYQAEQEQKTRKNWFQVYAAWHLVSVDLFLFTGLYFAMGVYGLDKYWPGLAEACSLWMLLWSLAWLGGLGLSPPGRKFLWRLPQWLLFLALSVLTYWGA